MHWEIVTSRLGPVVWFSDAGMTMSILTIASVLDRGGWPTLTVTLLLYYQVTALTKAKQV